MNIPMPAPDDYRGTVVSVGYAFGRVQIAATRSGEDLAIWETDALRGARVRPGDTVFVKDGIIWTGGDAERKPDVRADA